jgi:hypothetical protein
MKQREILLNQKKGSTEAHLSNARWTTKILSLGLVVVQYSTAYMYMQQMPSAVMT